MIQQGTEHISAKTEVKTKKRISEGKTYNDASMAHKSVLFSNPETTR